MPNTSIKRVILFSTLILSLIILLGSCASQPTPASYDPPGFFIGIVHGLLILFSFVGSIFMDIRIYAFPNSGVMYDFGYLIGLFVLLGVAAS